MKSPKMNIRALRLACLSALALGSMNVYAANTASTDALATVIVPISISKTTDIQFGRFSAGAGVSTLLMTNLGVRSVASGAAILAPSTVSAAVFAITGEPSATYTITLPATVTLTGPGTPATDMVLSSLTPNPAVGAGALSVGGTEALVIGGTLTVAAVGTQTAGLYTGNFTVQVDYN